tara:strand:- start:37 stop:273 length:237 start_codon:yes stop_codon:yes gene_type:complete
MTVVEMKACWSSDHDPIRPDRSDNFAELNKAKASIFVLYQYDYFENSAQIIITFIPKKADQRVEHDKDSHSLQHYSLT